MIRKATVAQMAELEAFLSVNAETSMFLRSNLAAHGIGDSKHPHATDFYLWPAAGAIRAVFGVTRGGYLMCQVPGGEEAAHAAFARALGGQQWVGLTGEATQSGILISSLAPTGPVRMNHVEPLYRRDLAGLDVPGVTLRAPERGDLDWLGQWFAGYAVETGTGSAHPGEAYATGRARAADAVLRDHVRLLVEDGEAVAMAAINAEVESMVQVGGVYVPRDGRGQGRARRVVGGLLAECRDRGITRAMLFSNNDAASRAYEAVGFERVGSYRVFLLEKPETVEEDQ